MKLVNVVKKGALKLCNQLTAKVAPELALKLARYSLFTPQRHNGNWPNYVKRMTLKTKSGNVAVYKYGQGKCVWLVHDWSSSARQSLGLMRKLESQGFSVVAFDLPAHGNSEGKQATLPTLISAFDQIAKELFVPNTIITTGIGATVIAHSRWIERFTNNLVLINPELSPYQKFRKIAEEKGVSDQALEALLKSIEKKEKVNIKTLDPAARLKGFGGNIQVVNNKRKNKQCPTKFVREMAWEN